MYVCASILQWIRLDAHPITLLGGCKTLAPEDILYTTPWSLNYTRYTTFCSFRPFSAFAYLILCRVLNDCKILSRPQTLITLAGDRLYPRPTISARHSRRKCELADFYEYHVAYILIIPNTVTTVRPKEQELLDKSYHLQKL